MSATTPVVAVNSDLARFQDAFARTLLDSSAPPDAQIANLVSQKAFLFSCRPIKNILNEFQFNGDVKYYLNEININFENNLILEDIEKTKHIERYIDSLFR